MEWCGIRMPEVSDKGRIKVEKVERSAAKPRGMRGAPLHAEIRGGKNFCLMYYPD